MSASASCAEIPEGSDYAPISLRRNFAWTFAGNVVYAGSQWGMLVALTKLGNPQIVGQFALGLAIAAPVMMFSNLSLRIVVVTDPQGRSRFGNYLALRLATTAFALLIIAGIGFGAKYHLGTALVIAAVGLAKCFESISDLLYGVFQRHERMDWIAKSMILKGPLSLAALGLAVYLSHSLLCGVLALALVWGLLLFGYDVRNCVRLLGAFGETGTKTVLRPRWMPVVIAGLARTAVPLAFVQALVSLSGNLPRYYVERYCGERELGIFAALAYVPVAGTTVVNALAGSAFPKLAKYYALEDMAAFRKLVLQLVAIGALLGTVGVLTVVLCGRPILTILYRPEYAHHTDVFLWIMVAAGIGYVGAFLGNMATATGAFTRFVIPYCVFSAVAVIACWVLIPAFKLRGASWAMCAVSVVSCIVSVVIFALVRGHRVYEPPK